MSFGKGGSGTIAPSSNDTQNIDNKDGFPVSNLIPTTAPNLHSQGSFGGTIGQKLVKTGTISLEVKRISENVDTIQDIAEHYGGYLSSSTVSGILKIVSLPP